MALNNQAQHVHTLVNDPNLIIDNVLRGEIHGLSWDCAG
jgi:hypothetical protein